MCLKKEKGRAYDKIRCFFVINKKQIYGPILPTLGGSSDMSMASLHAEEGTIKLVESLGIPLKNGLLYCIRFTYDKVTNAYTLCRCVPCLDCINFLTKKNIRRIVISTDDPLNPLVKVNIEDLLDKSQKSSGRRKWDKKMIKND
tara:strand:- start:185 stop:616 length:432 start_codon:yes stop_codon:yes gene_type:complete